MAHGATACFGGAVLEPSGIDERPGDALDGGSVSAQFVCPLAWLQNKLFFDRLQNILYIYIENAFYTWL